MQAVIFDMDGVLLDSETHWRRIEGEYLRSLIPHWDDAAQESIIGRSFFDVYGLLVRDHGLRLSQEEVLEHYHSLAFEIYGVQAEPIEGVSQLIEELREKGLTLGLASSSPHRWIDIVLKRFSLEACFSAVVSGEQFPGRGKPEPDIYLETARLLDVEPGKCAAIEDSPHGVSSAKKAGMFCVGLRNNRNAHQDLSLADVELCSGPGLTYSQLLSVFHL